MPHTIIPHVLLIAIKNDQVLMLKRVATAPFGAGHYSFIGGKVEEGESFSHAIVREAKEEAGLLVCMEDLVYVHTLYAHCSDGDLVAITFTTHIWQGEAYNSEPHKHATIDWYPYTALPSPILPLNMIIADCWLKGIAYTEYNYRAK